MCAFRRCRMHETKMRASPPCAASSWKAESPESLPPDDLAALLGRRAQGYRLCDFEISRCHSRRRDAVSVTTKGIHLSQITCNSHQIDPLPEHRVPRCSPGMTAL